MEFNAGFKGLSVLFSLRVNLKFSLSTPGRRIVGEEVYHHLFLISSLDGCQWLMYAPATFSPGQDHGAR